MSLSFETKFGTFSSWTDLLCYATVCITTWILHDSITFFLMYILIKNHNHDFSFRTYCINIIYFKGIFALRMKGLHAFLLCYGVQTWNLGWFLFFLCVCFFLIFTLLLTVSQHKTCDVYIFICIKRKYKSRRQILKYWITSIFHNLVFWQLFACFPQNYGLCVCPWRLVHTDKEEIKELSSCGLHFFITIATWPII